MTLDVNLLAAPADSPATPRRRRVRRGWARRLAVRLHRWTGFALLIWFVFEAVSGSYLAVADDVDRWLHPAQWSHGAVDLGPSTAVRAAQRAVPNSTATEVVFPHEAHGIYQVWVQDRQSADRVVNVDPSSGRVLEVDDPSSGFTPLVLRLHESLNTDDVLGLMSGRTLVGWLGLCWLVNLLLGVAVVRKRRRSLNPRAVVRARGQRYRFQLALHKTVGLLALVPALTAVLTGLVFAFPSQAVSVFDATLPGTVGGSATALPTSTPTADGGSRSLDEVAAAAREHGGGPIKQVAIPTGNPLGVFSVVTDGGGYDPIEGLGAPGGDVTVYVDQYSGRLVGIGDDDGSVADQVANEWNPGVHFGVFAGWLSRGLWLLLGIAVVLLASSAVLLRSGRWPWQRGRGRRQAEARFRRAELAAEVGPADAEPADGAGAAAED